MSGFLDGGKVTVDDSVTLIAPAGRTDRTVTVRNVGSTAVHVGPESVDGDWIALAENEARRLVVRGPVYGVCASGSTDVSFDVVG